MALIAAQSPTLLGPDPSLPHRDCLLDATLMMSELATALGWNIDSCSLERVKYRVGESLRVCYSLSIDSSPHLIALRCFSGAAIAKTLLRGEPDLVLDHLNSAAWLFPRDRKLKALERFWTEPTVQQRVFGSLPDSMQLVSYAPEKAATLKIELAGTTHFIKLVESGHREIASRYASLAPALDRCGVAAPSLVSVHNDLKALVMSEVSGPTLAEAPTETNWSRCGVATAALHKGIEQSIVSELPEFGRLTLSTLRTATDRISKVRPDLGDDVAALFAWLSHHAPDARSEGTVAVHGDLHAKNVVIGVERVGFIDLDQASRASAAAEIGSALAALRYGRVVKAGAAESDLADDDSLDSAEKGFLTGYDRRARLPDPLTLRWYIVAALIGERALRSVNRVRVDGLEHLPALIEAASTATEWTLP